MAVLDSWMCANGPDMHRGSVHEENAYTHSPGFTVWEDDDVQDSTPFGPGGRKRRVFVRFVHTRLRYSPTGRTLIVASHMFVPSNDAEPLAELKKLHSKKRKGRP
jgi:hypothetical protein